MDPAWIVDRKVAAWYLGLVIPFFLGVCVYRWPPSALQYDLRVYVVSAAAYLDGSKLYWAHLAYPDDIAMGFTYPPFAVIGFLPFTFVGTGTGRVAMVLLCGLATLLIAWLVVRELRPGWPPYLVTVVAPVVAAAALFLEPVAGTFGYGQINLLLLALLLTDLLGHLPRRYRGVLVGISTGIKLTPGIFIVFLVVTRRYREAVTAATATAATIVVGWLIAPGASAEFWGGLIFDPDRPGIAHFIANQSLRGVIARLTGSTPGPVWMLAAAAAAVLGLLAARRAYDAGQRFEAVLLAATTGLLVSPVSWASHWVWALPVCALLWSRLSTSPATAVLAAGWTGTMILGLPWRAPYFNDREYTHQGVDLLTGNSYAIVGIAFVLSALVTRREAVHRPPTGTDRSAVRTLASASAR